MTKLEKMKERLAKQKEQDTKNLEIVPKIKQKPLPFVPRIKALETKSNEEETIRVKLKELLDIKSKADRALFLEKFIKGNNWLRQQVNQRLVHLPKKLQNDFISKYLDQSLDVLKYFTIWEEDPEIHDAIKLRMDTLNKPVDSTKESSLVETLVQRALEHAESKDKKIISKVDISGDRVSSYYNILSSITSKKEKQQKLHEKLAKDYIDIAKELDISDPEKLTIIALSNSIDKKKEFLLSKVPENFKKMSDEDVLEYAEESGLDTIYSKDGKYTITNINILRIKVLKDAVEKFIENASNPLGRIESKHIDLEGIKEAIESKPTIIPSHKLLKKPIGKHSTEPILSTGISKKDADLQVKNTKYKLNLAEKIHRITGEDLNHLSILELHEKYDELEKGQVYLEEFNRDSIIDKLVELSYRERDFFADKTTEELMALLESGTKKPDDSVLFNKCIDEYKKYDWIDADVSGVWLASPSGDISVIEKYVNPHISLTTKGNLLGSEGHLFYPAKKAFFNLQCKNEHIQKGLVFTVNNESFIVGYMIPKKDKEKFKYCLKVGKPGFVLLIQDENLFNLQKNKLKIYYSEKLKNLDSILEDDVDEHSVEVAKTSLSEALTIIAPKVKDYERDSMYIAKIIMEIGNISSLAGTAMTNKVFFTSIANIIVYLDLDISKIFKVRIQNEYYLPEILPRLSQEDKLPELSGKDEESVDLFISFIKSKIHILVRGMAIHLLRRKDPTIRRYAREIQELYAPKLKIKKDLFVNKNDIDKIPEEKLVIYKDVENDNKLYAFDIDKISLNFSSGDFKNPYTGKEFNRFFKKLYMVSYYDSVNNRNYDFPFIILYENFKHGKHINIKTGRPFDANFINFILKGNNVLYDRVKKFKILDHRLAYCKNNYEGSPENTIFYKDDSDASIYCFSIQHLVEILNSGNINPYTGRRFSRNFISNFKNTFNIKPILAEDLGGTDVLYKETDGIANPSEIAIIPDLWDIISGGLFKEEEDDNKVDMGFNGTKNNDPEDDTFNDGTSKDGISDSKEDSTSARSTSSESSSITESLSDDIVKPVEVKPVEVKPVEGKPIDPKPEEGKPNDPQQVCENCKKNSCIFKSVGFDTEVKFYCFCSTKCMEQFEFPKFKKK